MKSRMSRTCRSAVVACLVGLGAAAALAPAASASSSSNGCVTLVRWDNHGTFKGAVVSNSCGSKQCYKIDIPYHVDPTYSVAAHATEDDKYGTTTQGTDQARKIYGGGSC